MSLGGGGEIPKGGAQGGRDSLGFGPRGARSLGIWPGGARSRGGEITGGRNPWDTRRGSEFTLTESRFFVPYGNHKTPSLDSSPSPSWNPS